MPLSHEKKLLTCLEDIHLLAVWYWRDLLLSFVAELVNFWLKPDKNISEKPHAY
jgi:hypothetical protein